MISKKELQYVDDWARKIPMPGYEYSIAVLKELKDSFELFNKVYKDKEYSFIFSNSEEIKLEVLSKNLCHMLGIDYKNIMGEYYNYYRNNVFGTSSIMSSYDLLLEILDKMEVIATMDNDPRVSCKVINYYKSAVKCAILKRLSEFDKFNFGAINYYGTKDDIDYDNCKYLFVPSNEPITPYFMMGIKYSPDEYTYVVNTLLAPENPKQFFDNQEVIIPTQILVSDSNELRKLIATPEEKIGLLTMYSNIINRYGLPNKINIYGDYEATLNDMVNTKTLSK